MRIMKFKQFTSWMFQLGNMGTLHVRSFPIKAEFTIGLAEVYYNFVVYKS